MPESLLLLYLRTLIPGGWDSSTKLHIRVAAKLVIHVSEAQSLQDKYVVNMRYCRSYDDTVQSTAEVIYPRYIARALLIAAQGLPPEGMQAFRELVHDFYRLEQAALKAEGEELESIYKAAQDQLRSAKHNLEMFRSGRGKQLS